MKNEPQFYPINTADAQAIKHRIRFIFFVVVLALVGLTLTVFGPQFLPRTKYFSSTATIEINDGPMNIGGLPLSPIQPGTIIRLPNYADELKKESILSNVVEGLKLTERLTAPDKPVSKAQAVSILQRTLVVKQTGLSLFKITAFNADRSLAAEIANAVVVVYKEERLKIARGDSENVLAEMREELDAKRGEAKRLFAACSQLRIKYEIIDSDPDSADSELSINTEEGQAEKKRKLSEYSEAKAEYLSRHALFKAIEQRYAASRFDEYLHLTPVKILERAEPEALTTPTHKLPSDTLQLPNANIRILLIVLCGVVAGVGLTFIALRDLLSGN